MLFDVLLSPLTAFFTSNCSNIDKESGSKKLFFEDFCRKIFFSIIYQVASLRSLVTELETNELSTKIGFEATPFSTLKDAFTRFDARHFKQLYESTLNCFDWIKVKCFEELGVLCIVDGSLFPTLIQMEWADYKRNTAACKLHLCFELNRMIPTSFIVGSGNSSERDFLVSIAQKAVTYIADRGYFSFDLGRQLVEKQAFFLIRIKSNLLFEVDNVLSITHTVPLPACFFNICDQIIHFTNDDSQNSYRLVRFSIGLKTFFICTNRLDLNTLQVIMLYSFRWQVELMFKFLKCSLHGIHLFNNTENGVQVQFYLWLSMALLQLRFKQVCLFVEQNNLLKINDLHEKNYSIELFISYFGGCSETFAANIAKMLYSAWKLSKKFLLLLKNSITKIPNFALFDKFSAA